MDAPQWLANLFQLTVVVDDGDPDSLAFRETVLYELGDGAGRDRGQYRMEYLRVPANVRVLPPPEVIGPAHAIVTMAGTLVTMPIPPPLEGEDRAVTGLLPRVVFPEVGAGGVPTHVTFETRLISSAWDPQLVSTGIADPETPLAFSPARCTASRTEWNRDADGSYPAELPHDIFRRWTDTRQDEGDVRVFRPHGEVTEPARFRESFEIRADGAFIDFVLGPNDAVVPLAGRWRATGPFTMEVGSFQDGSGQARTLELASYQGTVLKIRAA